MKSSPSEGSNSNWPHWCQKLSQNQKPSQFLFSQRKSRETIANRDIWLFWGFTISNCFSWLSPENKNWLGFWFWLSFWHHWVPYSPYSSILISSNFSSFLSDQTQKPIGRGSPLSFWNKRNLVWGIVYTHLIYFKETLCILLVSLPLIDKVVYMLCRVGTFVDPRHCSPCENKNWLGFWFWLSFWHHWVPYSPYSSILISSNFSSFLSDQTQKPIGRGSPLSFWNKRNLVWGIVYTHLIYFKETLCILLVSLPLIDKVVYMLCRVGTFVDPRHCSPCENKNWLGFWFWLSFWHHWGHKGKGNFYDIKYCTIGSYY